MSTKPKEILKKRLGYFDETGARMSDYPLLRAAYFEEVETAKKVLNNDPGQINTRDPYSGLTPLHVAIFRGNRELVKIFLGATGVDVRAEDRFGRNPVDMLDYTTDQVIFKLVIDEAYPTEKQTMGSTIVPLKQEDP